jgi:hypothetical protein
MGAEHFLTTVPCNDRVYVVPMGRVLEPQYRIFERETTAQAIQMLDEGDLSGVFPWFTTLLRFPDMPWREWHCRTRRGLLLGSSSVLLPENEPTSLERVLIDYVAQQHHAHLPVLVFTENDDHAHLQRLLEQVLPTLRVAALTKEIPLLNRKAWLWCRQQEGLDVLITNPGLVAGLNMVPFPRIIYKRPPLSWAQLLQSARCSHRPGQHHPVEVVVCLYEHSLSLSWMLKMAAGEQVPTEAALVLLLREVWESYQQPESHVEKLKAHFR